MIVPGRPVGRLLDAATRVWVRGDRAARRPAPRALASGPTGDVARVGSDWLADEVARCGGRFADVDAGAGLLPAMSLLDGPGFDAAMLQPDICDFYARTSRWRLQVWAQWCSAAWPFGWLISMMFAGGWSSSACRCVRCVRWAWLEA